MKRCFTLLPLILLAGLAFGQQEQSPDLAALLTQAQQAQAANNYAAAAASYKQAVKLRPDIPELRANLGLMQHETGDYPEAIRSFQEALRLKPTLYVPNLFLGIDYVQMGKAKEAIPLLQKAEKMNTADPLPSLTLGRAWSSLGDYPQATRAFRRAIQIDPKQSSAWFDMGIAQLDEVEAAARSMTDDHAQSSYAKALYAESLVKQSRYKEAAVLYAGILSASDQPPCMRSESGLLSLKQGDPKTAEQQFQTERSQHPECLLAILGQARLRLDAADASGALSLIQQAWNADNGFLLSNTALLFDGLSPEHTQSLLALAQQLPDAKLAAALSQAAQGEDEPREQLTSSHMTTASPAAIDQARHELLAGHYASCANMLRGLVDSRNVSTLETLSACAFFTGDYALASDAAHSLQALSTSQDRGLYWSIKANERLALESLARFQQLEPDSARTHILLGDIDRQRENYDDAIKEYSKALELSPSNPAALLGLASAYFGNANSEKAIEIAQKALALSPSDPEINLLMGEALISQHKFADAEPYLLKSLNAKPQMLPHVHALLGEAYDEDGKTQDAIRELKLGAPSDQDGSLHYRLSRLYSKIGDQADSAIALQQMKALQQKRREGAVTIVQESHLSTSDDAP